MNQPAIDLICRALASPIRRDILVWLREPSEYFISQEATLELGVSVGQISDRCGLAKSTVSVHVDALLRADLITYRKVRQSVFLKRNESVIKMFIEQIAADL
jgi:DNA-binding transcriptional ArsR family regulator